jgi:hypothetical protein
MRKPRIYIRVLCVLQKVKHNRRLKMCGTMFFGPSSSFSISPSRSEDESAIFVTADLTIQLRLGCAKVKKDESRKIFSFV